jgi:hypothetical protein
MPLKQSASSEALHENIRELVKSGKKQKEAIAIGLAHQRKMKMMAEGGMVEDQMDADDAKADMAGEAVYPMGDDEQGLSANVMSEQELAEGLQAAKMKANDTEPAMAEADDKVAGHEMAASNLSEDAKMAILAKRAKRKLAMQS